MIRAPLAIPLREASAPLVLALDIGTSGLRAFLFDAKARPITRCVASDDRPVRVSRDGEATVDADERVRAACAAIDAVLRASGKRAVEVSAVAVSTFWHSVLGVDERGRPTTPVLTWADTRARDAAAKLRRRLGEAAVHSRTGCMIHASYLPAKITYLREAFPDEFARSEAWLSLGEYLYLRLFGVRRAAHGMASATGLYAQRARRWDHELLSRIGVDERTLSPISDEPLSGLGGTFARRWPALARVPWYPAIGDGACSNVGAGAVRADTAALMLGTSGALRVILATDDPPALDGGWTYRLDERRAIVGGALSNGGNVLSWLARAFPAVDLDALSKDRIDEHGLTALPLLSGDRSPTWDDAARGLVAGIGVGTTSEQIARAVVEGVACRVARLWRLVDAAVPGIQRVIGTGGAALGHPWLLQLFADAMGRPVMTSAAGEGSARGATLWALERAGVIADIGAIPSPLGRTYRPRADAHDRLARATERQARLERAVAGFDRADGIMVPAERAGRATWS